MTVPLPSPQRSRLRRVAAVAVVMAAVVAAPTACGSDNSSTSTTKPTATTTNATKLYGEVREPLLQVGTVTLPDVTDNQAAVPFTMKAAPGHFLLVYFGYTHCPDLCPTTMAALRQSYRSIGSEAFRRLDMAMVTVDPQADTPTVLSDYLGSFFAQYHALRTTDLQLLAAAEKPFLASSTLTPNAGGTYDVGHTATTYLVDDTGAVVIEWPFGVSAEQITHDLRVILARPVASTTASSTTVSSTTTTPGSTT